MSDIPLISFDLVLMMGFYGSGNLQMLEQICCTNPNPPLGGMIGPDCHEYIGLPLYNGDKTNFV